MSKKPLVINQSMILAQIRKEMPKPCFLFTSKKVYNRSAQRQLARAES